MIHEAINPHLRSAAYLSWNVNNICQNIAYHMRFFAFRKNAAVLNIRDSEIPVVSDSLLILKPGIPYDFHNVAAGKQFDLYSCNFDLTQDFRSSIPFRTPAHEQDFIPDHVIDTSYVLPELGDMILLQGCPNLCQQVQHIYELHITNRPFSEEIASGIIKSVLFEAMQMQDIRGDFASVSRHGAEIARETLQYIREHCTEHISEQSVAAVLGYHPYYLSRLTRQYYNVTPYRYLMQCRLDHAVHLLCSTDLSIGAAAEACGFSTQAHFTAFIRRETGMPPNVLRKNGWHGESSVL